MFLIKEQTACSPLGGLGEHWTASPVALDLATTRGRSGLPDLEPHLLHLGGSGFCGEEQGLWGVFAGLGLNFHRLQHRGRGRMENTWAGQAPEAPPFQSLHLLTFQMRLGRAFSVPL